MKKICAWTYQVQNSKYGRRLKSGLIGFYLNNLALFCEGANQNYQFKFGLLDRGTQVYFFYYLFIFLRFIY